MHHVAVQRVWCERGGSVMEFSSIDANVVINDYFGCYSQICDLSDKVYLSSE